MKQKQHSQSPKNQNNSLKKFRFVVVWFFAGALVAGATVLLVRVSEEDAHVAKIARQFKCVCKMNCGLTVAHCKCKEPGGATEIKNMIRLGLKKGLSDEAITSLLAEGGGTSR